MRGFGSAMPRTLNLSISLYLYYNDPKIKSRTENKNERTVFGFYIRTCGTSYMVRVLRRHIRQTITLNCSFMTGKKEGHGQSCRIYNFYPFSFTRDCW